VAILPGRMLRSIATQETLAHRRRASSLKRSAAGRWTAAEALQSVATAPRDWCAVATAPIAVGPTYADQRPARSRTPAAGWCTTGAPTSSTVAVVRLPPPAEAEAPPTIAGAVREAAPSWGSVAASCPTGVAERSHAAAVPPGKPAAAPDRINAVPVPVAPRPAPRSVPAVGLRRTGAATLWIVARVRHQTCAVGEGSPTSAAAPTRLARSSRCPVGRYQGAAAPPSPAGAAPRTIPAAGAVLRTSADVPVSCRTRPPLAPGRRATFDTATWVGATVMDCRRLGARPI
jgi:hypothetical protein